MNTGAVQRNAQCGFTLTEIMIATVICGFVLAGVFSVFIGIQRGAYATNDVLTTKSRLGVAEQQLALDLRNTQSVITSEPTRFTVRVRYYRDAASTTREVTYEYDADSRSIQRIEGTRTQTIVSNVDSATFKYYQRKQAGGSLETSTPSAVNAISVLVTPSPRRGQTATPDNRQYTLATFQLRRIAFP